VGLFWCNVFFFSLCRFFAFHWVHRLVLLAFVVVPCVFFPLWLLVHWHVLPFQRLEVFLDPLKEISLPLFLHPHAFQIFFCVPIRLLHFGSCGFDVVPLASPFGMLFLVL